MIPFEWIKICREPRHFSEVVVQRYNLTWLTWNIGRNIFDWGYFLKKFNLKEHRARDRHMLTFANENREENKTVSVHWICNLNVNWQDPDLRKRTCMLDFFFTFPFLSSPISTCWFLSLVPWLKLRQFGVTLFTFSFQWRCCRYACILLHSQVLTVSACNIWTWN